jgi:hypothetical protein
VRNEFYAKLKKEKQQQQQSDSLSFSFILGGGLLLMLFAAWEVIIDGLSVADCVCDVLIV